LEECLYRRPDEGKVSLMATIRRMPLSLFFGLFAPTHVLETTFSLEPGLL
jgi:hypothetical protein